MTRIRVEKLTRLHPVDGFECGQEPLDRFLIRYALASQLANASQSYLAIAEEMVVGYYTLVVGEVGYEDAPERLTKGLARHPIPVMVLARLAIERRWQGKGIGAGLLKDGMSRTVRAADIAGIRAMAAHAKDDSARAFYEHFDFIPSPADPLHLYLLTKDLRRIAADQA